jgi:hypothetical protein
MSSAEVSFQEASARYWTLAVHQNEYLPQVSRRVEGCGMQERAAVSPTAIPYVPVIDVVMSKEEPQLYKVKLPDASHLSIPIYSRGNKEEYLVHVVTVLRIIEQKRMPRKCRMLAKAVVRWSKALKNLQEVMES